MSVRAQINCIQEYIEALKQQRHRFERLVIILRNNQPILDMWTAQYIRLLELKRETGFISISLSQRERKLLEQVISPAKLEEYLIMIDNSIAQLISERKTLTITEMEGFTKKIDEIIVDLITCVNQIKQGSRIGLRRAKDIILRRAMPIGGGIALLAIDIEAEDWVSFIFGGELIRNGAMG